MSQEVNAHPRLAQGTAARPCEPHTRGGSKIDSYRSRSPVTATAVLLGICVALYLAVAGVVHILTPLDAAAAGLPDDAATPAATATASTSTSAEGETSTTCATDDTSKRHTDAPTD